MTTHKSRAICFRLDSDLDKAIKSWVAHNPGFSLSRLANLAIRQFITNPQELKSVDVVPATDKMVQKSTRKMMKQHKDMLEKLK